MKVLLIFPNKIKNNIAEIKAGTAPRERLYGFYELLDNTDYTFETADSRFEGLSNKIICRLRGYGINLVDIPTLFKIARADVVVVKDNVSFMVSMFAKILGKPVVYYDSLFPIPKMKVKRFFLKRCLSMCSRIVGYNKQQVSDYEQALNLKLQHKYTHLDFLLDEQFYGKVFESAPAPQQSGYFLSIGRDVGRDFKTLVKAASITGYPVKIVTLPYLLEGIELPDNVEVLQNISYEELFTLYKGAIGVVVPLKNGLSYASGIRAIMESLVLKKPSIVSETPFVTNNCLDYPNIVAIQPENGDALSEAMTKVMSNDIQVNDYTNNLPEYSVIHQHIDKMLRSLVA